MYAMHKFTTMGATLCDIVVVVIIMCTYVHTCEPLTADEDDDTKTNAWVLWVWGSTWPPVLLYKVFTVLP